MILSPLRYPGGKAKLAPFMGFMLSELNIDGTYIEPFGGGAGIALDLLFNDKINHIVINDYDKAIAAFWKHAVYNNKEFIDRIESLPITMKEWLHQREVLLNSTTCSFDLAVATFFLNRTNRSGILLAGPIGGREQSGEWLMDARFNKAELIQRLRRIGERKKDITVYNKEVSRFITQYLPQYDNNSFMYLDPPYYIKGRQLYMNYFGHDDHIRIKKCLKDHVHCPWIVTYDCVEEIEKIYNDYRIKNYEISYSASTKRTARELMIFSDDIKIPTKRRLKQEGVDIKFGGVL